MKSGVTYRMVAGPSFVPLAKVMAEMGEPMPNPLLSVGFVAEDEYGNIVAHLVLQNLPVIEPVHADTGAGESIRKLFEMAEEFILKSGAPRVLGHTSNSAVMRMLHRAFKAKEMKDTWFDWRKPEPLEKAG